MRDIYAVDAYSLFTPCLLAFGARRFIAMMMADADFRSCYHAAAIRRYFALRRAYARCYYAVFRYDFFDY